MEKVMNECFEVGVELELDEKRTDKNVQLFFSKYRYFIEKQKVIEIRSHSSGAFEEVASFGSRISDPTGKKVEQMEKFKKFTEYVDNTYKTFSNRLTKEEKVIYEKTLKTHHSHESVMEELSLTNKGTYYIKKRKCYLKVALWFDLDIYN